MDGSAIDGVAMVLSATGSMGVAIVFSAAGAGSCDAASLDGVVTMVLSEDPASSRADMLV
jgi:hypothetical protein